MRKKRTTRITLSHPKITAVFVLLRVMRVVHGHLLFVCNLVLEAKGGLVLDLDRLFRRSPSIKEELKRREKELDSLAAETGGGFWLPASAEEMIRQAVEVAQEVDSQYVVTYALQRSINAEAGEYLKIDVISRRVGLKIRARRAYLAKPHDATPFNSPLSPTPQ